MDLQEQKELERVKTQFQLLVEYHKLVVENSMRAQRGLLLCHGGAITAILMSGKAWLLPFCLVFGVGAGFTVLSSGLGYITNYCYMWTWGNTNPWLDRLATFAHVLAIALYAISIGLFFWNLWRIFCTMGA